MSLLVPNANYAILLIATVAAATDLYNGKIYNSLTAPSAICGIMAASFYLGWWGAVQSLLGILLGLLLFGWMFWLRHLGGGDVKLLMAFGSWGGIDFTLKVAVLAILIGGIFSIFSLIWNGKFLAFIRKMQVFVYSIFIDSMKVEVPKVNRFLKIPFGVPMAIAAIGLVWVHPLQNWVLGSRLWH